MNRKIKLIALGASMLMSLCIMVMGVFAANTQTVTVSNTVGFTFTPEIKANVTYTIGGTGVADTSKQETPQTLASFDGTETTTSLTASIGELGAVAFANNAAKNSTIIITITIQNLKDYGIGYEIYNPNPEFSSTDVDHRISLTVSSTGSENDAIGPTYDYAGRLAAKDETTDSITYTITWTLLDDTADQTNSFDDLLIELFY